MSKQLALFKYQLTVGPGGPGGPTKSGVVGRGSVGLGASGGIVKSCLHGTDPYDTELGGLLA